jgi:hypothetical protein
MLIKAITLAVICHLILIPGVVAEPGFEPAPVLKATKILPPELLKGPHHRVMEDVRTDGYLNYYMIGSDFGEFTAEGTPLLRIRIREIEALARIDEVSKTDVFVEAAKQAGVDMGKGLWQGVSHPGKTVKSAPKGASRLFKKISRGAKLGIKQAGELIDGGDDGESGDDPERIRESYYEVSEGEREWAARFGVNPYSSNETLRKAISKLNKVEFVGEIGFSVASTVAIPIPGLGTLAGTINEAASEIWTTDPYQLRRDNIQKLKDRGVPETTIEAFINNGWYNPTMQTFLVRLLLSMEGVSGTMSVLDVAVEAESEAEARYFLNGVLLIIWFHKNEVPVERVFAQSGLPQVVTTDGRQIAFAPVDYLYWGEYFAGAVKVAVSREILGKRELWVLGAVSDRARTEIEALGVTVHDQMGKHAQAKLAESAHSDDVTGEEPATE